MVRAFLAACILVATYEQPIGHSMDGMVSRISIAYCGQFTEPQIRVIEEIVSGRTGKVVGDKGRTTYHPIPALKTQPDPETGSETAPQPMPLP